jgi:iron(III) transport system substrate-binding protein
LKERPVLHLSRLRLVVALTCLLLLSACGGDQQPASPQETDAEETGDVQPPEEAEADAEGPLTVYSGRSEELVGPLLEQFTAATGIDVRVRYCDTAELAATILEEGRNSPADVYFGHDAGALGALSTEGLLRDLPADRIAPVEDRFRAADGTWVGVSGRARVLVYSTELVDPEELPDSVLDLTEERWRGRVGWAPTNGSFQAFVTAMRIELGDDQTRRWIEDMIANDVQAYEKNGPIVEAAGRGEIEVGLVNHYYRYQLGAEDPNLGAENHFFEGGDVGSLVNVAGVGVLQTSDQPQAANELVAFLLSEEAQRYFAEETYEYPLVAGIPADDRLPELESIETPELDLGNLEDLEGTLQLLNETGALR